MKPPTKLSFHAASDDIINVFDGKEWLPEISDGSAAFLIKLDLSGGPLTPTHCYLTGRISYTDRGWLFELGVPGGSTLSRDTDEDHV